MKYKRGQEGPRIKVVTDPKKLAWLKAQITKQKVSGRIVAAVKKKPSDMTG